MGQVSDDGYWQEMNGEWVPTELQNKALSNGAQHHTFPAENTPQPNAMMTHSQIGVMQAPPQNGLKIVIIVTVSLVVGVILVGLLAGVLYVWASSLAEEQDSELIGTWTNPADRMFFESNGDIEESTGTFETWYTTNSDVFFEDDDEYYYNFKYIVVDDLFFLAPYDASEELLEDDCIAYLKGETGATESIYNDRIEKANTDGLIPSWCNP